MQFFADLWEVGDEFCKGWHKSAGYNSQQGDGQQQKGDQDYASSCGPRNLAAEPFDKWGQQQLEQQKQQKRKMSSM